MLMKALGTREHVLLWLDTKDPKEEYAWGLNCPAEQYAHEFELIQVPWELPISPLAREYPRTWGALAQRIRESSMPWGELAPLRVGKLFFET